MTLNTVHVVEFIAESNKIEGILTPPTVPEINAYTDFLELAKISISDLEIFVDAVQPGARLRDVYGLDVRVGDYLPPRGDPQIRVSLEDLLMRQQRTITHSVYLRAYATHLQYENLHPFTDGNGRSGRALWLWMMGKAYSPRLGFLHTFYYQALQDQRL